MTDSVDDIIEKLRVLVDGDEEKTELTIFDKNEVEKIRRLIELLDMFKGWGTLGRGVLWMLTGIAGAMIAYEQIASRLLK